MKITINIKKKLLNEIERLVIEHNKNDEVVDVSGTRTVEDFIDMYIDNAVYYTNRDEESKEKLKSIGLSISNDTCIICEKCGLSWNMDTMEQYYVCPNGCNKEKRITSSQLSYIEDCFL